ncbi:MAG: type II secretion system protein GspL [Candidatus Sumerlaeota bacterium]|nr:type II secretion system protein GspL [Candidatus Sumerlaeota bacterium]
MAGLKRCLGVDLGSSRIKVAEVVAEKAGLRLTRLLQADVDIPPGTDEEERALRMTRSLRELLKAHKVTTKDAVFCVPGQSVIYRPVKLPKTSPERLQRIVEYEARQQIPFPLDQTHFEFQVFENPETPEEVEVLLVAIKRETVGSYLRTFRRTGLRIASIGVSYLALFNYHKFDEGFVRPDDKRKPAKKPETEEALDEAKPGAKPAKKKSPFSLNVSLFGKKKPKEEEPPAAEDEPPAEEEERGEGAEPSEGAEDLFGAAGLFEEIKAYVNLGATMMDLAIEKQGKGGGVGFCRAIPHAGNEMTRAIQKALALDSFREAEEIKRAATRVLSTSFELEEQPAEVNQEASEAVTRLIDRSIVGELRRSLDFYISQPDGVAVDGIVLSGGQACLPHLARYIEEKIGIPVEVAKEVRNPAVEVSEDVKKVDLSSGLVAIGLALQGVGAAAISVDFLPEDLKTVREFKGKYPEVAAMAAMIIGMIVLSYNVGEDATRVYREEAQRLLDTVDPRVTQILKQFDDLAKERQDLKAKYDSIAKVAAGREVMLKLWAEILIEKPPEVVIDLAQLNADGTIALIGACETLTPVIEFRKNLEARTDLLANVDFAQNGLIETVDTQNRFPGDGDKMTMFSLSMRCLKVHPRLKTVPTPTPGATPAPVA